MQVDDQALCPFRFDRFLLLFERKISSLQYKLNTHPFQLTTPRFTDKAEVHFKRRVH